MRCKNMVGVQSMRRGQTATEYLIILAVTIIIALVAVSVLGGFPTLFTSQSGEMLSEAYWGSAKISITHHRIADTEGRFVFMNKMRYPIEIVKIALDDVELLEAADTIVPSGGSQLIEQTSGFTCTTQGDKYAYKVLVEYTYADRPELGVFTFTGLKPLIGVCQ
jgi:hypothetical protein